MLVLTRKVDECINIGDHVVVKVIGIDGMQVKLGIDAPGKVRILRQEVYEKIRDENFRSVGVEAGAFMKAAALFKKDPETQHG